MEENMKEEIKLEEDGEDICKVEIKEEDKMTESSEIKSKLKNVLLSIFKKFQLYFLSKITQQQFKPH